MCWTDGCAAQYKNKAQFLKIYQLDIKTRHRFFASCHRKGPSEPEGSAVKRALRVALTDSNLPLYDSEKSYKYLKEKCTFLKKKHDTVDHKKKTHCVNWRVFKFIPLSQIVPTKKDVKCLQSQVTVNHDLKNTMCAGELCV